MLSISLFQVDRTTRIKGKEYPEFWQIPQDQEAWKSAILKEFVSPDKNTAEATCQVSEDHATTVTPFPNTDWHYPLLLLLKCAPIVQENVRPHNCQFPTAKKLHDLKHSSPQRPWKCLFSLVTCKVAFLSLPISFWQFQDTEYLTAHCKSRNNSMEAMCSGWRRNPSGNNIQAKNNILGCEGDLTKSTAVPDTFCKRKPRVSIYFCDFWSVLSHI